MDLWSALWLLMTWCFSTRASVATVLITHVWVSSNLWVNKSKYIPVIYCLVQGWRNLKICHYSDVIMNAMASQITGVSIVYLIVCSSTDKRKHHFLRFEIWQLCDVAVLLLKLWSWTPIWIKQCWYCPNASCYRQLCIKLINIKCWPFPIEVLCNIRCSQLHDIFKTIIFYK